MPATAKWMFILVLDAVLCGFFGLGIAVFHFLWLEYATVRWPKVRYTDDYQTSFALACAAVVFVLTTLRQIKTRLESKSLRPGEIGFILIFAAIVMVGLTPVPGSNFPQYLYETNYPGKRDNGNEECKKADEPQPPKLERDFQ
jgi:hypothetical protein